MTLAAVEDDLNEISTSQIESNNNQFDSFSFIDFLGHFDAQCKHNLSTKTDEIKRWFAFNWAFDSSAIVNAIVCRMSDTFSQCHWQQFAARIADSATSTPTRPPIPILSVFAKNGKLKR